MLDHIYSFTDKKGNSPIEDAINKLTDRERSKVKAYIQILKSFGHNIRRPIADYLGEEIYELRPQKHRVFYFLSDGAKRMYFEHCLAGCDADRILCFFNNLYHSLLCVVTGTGPIS